ncbi:MAG: acetylornithine/succinylornithine family transaminase [Clostridia bacterium]|nr:acetylornithine/succinylornithine family transaminase [Clostridia bacterium]
MNTIIQNDLTYVAGTYARFPAALVNGKGAKAYDETGKEYIDLGSGIAVNTFGYSDEIWKNAVINQIDAISHTSNLYYTDPCTTLAKMLCEKTGMKKVFFGNSGAEANECAVKVARKWAYEKYGDESHNNVITLINSFHGRTIAMLSATGQEHFHHFFGPFPEGFLYAEANNLKSVRKLIEENKCCAVLIEIIQGEGGVMPLSSSFISGVQALCSENDLLFMVDEVQTGNGRTGELFAYMNYGVQPDVVSTAKGLGGGLPIGACLIGDKAKDALKSGDHGSTFGGNPIACAGAVSILERLTDDVMKGVKERSSYIFDALNGAKNVKSISGIGLMIGIEVEGNAREIVNRLLERGVLALTAKTKIRLLPPLNIDFDDLKKAIGILKEEIAK